QAWARETEASMDRNSYVDQSAARRTLLGDLFRRYREEVAPRHKGGDVEAYRLRAWERAYPLREFGVANVTTADVQEWINHRETEVAADTVLYEINLLHRVLKRAPSWNIALPMNPVNDRLDRPKASRGRDRRLYKGKEDWQCEEHWLLLAAAKARTPWLKPLIGLALETGMRRGELLKLEWSDVDLALRYGLARDTKNGDDRPVPFSS